MPGVPMLMSEVYKSLHTLFDMYFDHVLVKIEIVWSELHKI